MLARIIRLIETNEFPICMLLCLGHGELCINESDEEFSRASAGFVCICSFEHKVHAVAERKVLEKGNKLEEFLPSNDLESDINSFEVLVDWYDYASMRYGET